jgi:flavin-dependent amine oxidoreductase
LAQWLTGNDLLSLSADAFVASAQPIFLSQAADNRICVPRQPWHRMFVQPVVDRLQQAGARLLMGTRATQFHFEHERITGVRLQDGKMLQADWYVTAMAHHQLTPLLPERWLTRYAYFQQIAELTTTPCTVIQVRTARSIRVPRHIMMGTGSFPWMACKPSESDTGLVAVLTMPPGQPIIDTQEQVSTLLRSLGLLQPDSQLTSFRQHEVTHAVLGLHPGTKARRPIQLSPIPNLLLAGAWTDTGWPAILESAIVSGERCAEIINGRKPG